MPKNCWAGSVTPDPTIARDRLVEFFERDWFVSSFNRLSGNLNDLSRETGVARKDLVRKLRAWGVAVNDR